MFDQYEVMCSRCGDVIRNLRPIVPPMFQPPLLCDNCAYSDKPPTKKDEEMECEIRKCRNCQESYAYDPHREMPSFCNNCREVTADFLGEHKTSIKEAKESQDAHITDRLDRIEAKLDGLLAIKKVEDDFRDWCARIIVDQDPDLPEPEIVPCSESGICNQCGDPNKVLCSRHAAERSEEDPDLSFESSKKNSQK